MIFGSATVTYARHCHLCAAVSSMTPMPSESSMRWPSCGRGTSAVIYDIYAGNDIYGGLQGNAPAQARAAPPSELRAVTNTRENVTYDIYGEIGARRRQRR